MASDRVATGLHILLLAEYGASGGTRTYAKQLLSLYSRKGVRVTMLSTFEAADDEMERLCIQYGFCFVNLSSVVGKNDIFRGRFPFRHFREKRLLEGFIKESGADIVVASVGTPELFLGALCSAKKGIYILHTYPHGQIGPLKLWLRKLFFSLNIAASTKILTVSDFSRNQILRTWGLWGRENIVSVVYSSMGDVVAKTPRAALAVVNILTLGHVVPYKDPDTWIEVAVSLKSAVPDFDVSFRWVGDGPCIENCREKVASLGAKSYITFEGRHEDVSKYYAACDIYIQPSLIESLGLSVIDAMRYGIACVVTDAGGLPEVVADGTSGWVVKAGDVKELANRLELLVRDRELRERMGQCAQERYLERFANVRWLDEMWSVHESLLQQRRQFLVNIS